MEKLTEEEKMHDHYTKYHSYKEFEDTKEKLDFYYNTLKQLLLPYQSASTGLFSCDNVAFVRDNIYCATAVWALYLAYQRIDDDNGRRYELEHSAVKCMRGILFCYMQQVDNVEKFKANQAAENAFHCCYDARTGATMSESSDFNHLQLDIVALFILYTVQMIESGLQIIYNTDEVAFMQNLIFYLERSYRTSDFGLWGRGSKYNNGSVELHGSSVGAAKAVLESVNGFNLFGKCKGAPWSTLWVDMDAHNRNRTCLDSLLPQESKSKSVDAAQLPMISFPFFAVDQEELRQVTLQHIKKQLEGRYGLKRFRGDGYKTVVEDTKRKYYEPAEIKYFQGIECEWPIFFIYLKIDGLITGNQEQADEYEGKLDYRLKKNKNGFKLVPRFYYVTEDSIDQERAKNGSTKRNSSFDLPDENPIFLWGQALYMISELLREKLILPKDIDPIKRFIPLPERQKVSMRYSTVDSFVGDTVVQISPVVESKQLVDILSAYGFSAQTMDDVAPIEIWSSQELQSLCSQLGRHKKLGLSGRPNRPIGVLGTSKVYRIQGKTVVCFPLEFDTGDFYLAYDINMLIENLLFSLQFVARYWRMPRRPLFVFLIHRSILEGDRMEPILQVLSHFKQGLWNGVKVQLGRIQNFVASSVIETIDCVYPKQDDFESSLLSMHKSALDRTPSNQDLTMLLGKDNKCFYLKLQNDNNEKEMKLALALCKRPLGEIIAQLFNFKSGYALTIILEEVLRRRSLSFDMDRGTCYELLNSINQWAGRKKHWSLVRYTAGLCRKIVNSLAPSISAVLIRDKYISLGVFGCKEHVVNNPLPPGELADLLYDICSDNDIRDTCVQQELILHLGQAINKYPKRFDNILQIRVGWLAYAMRIYLNKDNIDCCVDEPQNQNVHVFLRESTNDIANLSPSKLKNLLLEVFSVNLDTEMCCLKKKQIFGALNRSPPNFYSKVWLVLQRSSAGLMINGQKINQQPYLSDMSENEVTWCVKVEELFIINKRPEFQYLIKETLAIIATMLERNDELYFKSSVDVDQIADKAIKLYESSKTHDYDVHKKKLDLTSQFCSLPTSEVILFITRSIVQTFLDDGINFRSVNECTTS